VPRQRVGATATDKQILHWIRSRYAYIHVIVRTRDTAPTSQRTRDVRTVYARPRTNERCSCPGKARGCRQHPQHRRLLSASPAVLRPALRRRDAGTVGSRQARGREHVRAASAPLLRRSRNVRPPGARVVGGSPPASSVTHLPMASVGPGGWEEGPVTCMQGTVHRTIRWINGYGGGGLGTCLVGFWREHG
jgi:hypothetical protein